MRPKWFVSLFDTTIAVDSTTVTALVMFDPAVVSGTEEREISRIWSLRRAMFHGQFVPQQVGAGESNQTLRMVGAAWTNDIEDTDTTLIVTGPSDILVTERVIHTMAWTQYINFPAAATVDQLQVVHGQDISFDVRTNINLRGDQILQYGFQSFSNISGTTLVRVIGIGRCLVVPP